MRMHVEQLEKDKRELAERMRVIGKWLDHVERAYRKEERPLLAKDYESQQENDRLTFEALQKSRVESSKQQHQLNLETKARLSRMLGDFKNAKNEILERRGQEYAEKQREASDKLREAKAKRIAAIKKAREEERLRKEAEEQKLREQEEEEARHEAGAFQYLTYLTRVMTLNFRAPRGGGSGTPRERSRGSRSRS
jgi:translation initiation factor 3 subunit A